MAGPNIIGVNAGSGLFVLAAAVLLPGRWDVVPLAAFAGALLACARAGIGITLLPRPLVEADLAAGRLRELAVADAAFRRTYFLVRHRSKYLTDGMRQVLQVVREEIAAP